MIHPGFLCQDSSPPPALFSPLDVPGLAIWWDTTDAAYISPPGGPYTSIESKHGGSNIGNINTTPGLTAQAFGVKTSFGLSNGGKWFVGSSGIGYVNGNPYTVFGIARTGVLTGTSGRNLFSTTSSPNQSLQGVYTGNPAIRVWGLISSSVVIQGTQTFGSNTITFVCARYDPSGLGNRLSTDGGDIQTNTVAVSAANTAYSAPNLGTFGTNGGVAWQGLLGICGRYNGALSDALCEKLEGWMCWTVNGDGSALPITHPYRNVFPPA